MPALSTSQQAAYFLHCLGIAIEDEDEDEFPTCTFYLDDGSIYWVPHKELNNSQETTICDLIDSKIDISEGRGHSVPPPERILLTGQDLTITNEMITAVKDLIAWVKTNEAEEDEYHVVLVPGAIIMACEDDDSVDSVDVQIAFPIVNRALYESDLRKQARFATTLIDRLGRPMDVILNNVHLEDVIAGTNHTSLMKQYREENADNDDVNVVELITDAITHYEGMIRLWREWLKNPDSAFLPGRMEVVDRENSILGNMDDIDGVVTLFGYPHVMDPDFITKLREWLTDWRSN